VKNSRAVYFAGELFSAKHLVGNAYLAEAIPAASHGRYLCRLPQDFELRGHHPQLIRDKDIRSLLECDLALFNFDGPELDSGTVVEFMFAKFADIPCVILRSDFRAAGDQGFDGLAGQDARDGEVDGLHDSGLHDSAARLPSRTGVGA
jgi:nucleoside 2-deoxyribosyltransferase